MRIVLGITGASGAIIGIRLLEALHKIEECETHLVISQGGALTIAQETDYSLEQVKALADVCYDENEIGAAIASGSFRTEGMIIAPCSMKSAAALSHGYAYNLLLRAADVCLKERRRLVLLPRETPMHSTHLQNLVQLANLGAMVVPPMMTFYHKPQTIDEMIAQLIGKILMYFGLPSKELHVWQGM